MCTNIYSEKKIMENIVMIFSVIYKSVNNNTNQFLYNCSHCCISTLLYYIFFFLSAQNYLE